MSTRNNARHVRQRKLNTKQPLRIIRENGIEDNADDESQRNIPQVETGVEKGEEIEYHLQAIIRDSQAAALGAKAAKASYIPTPDAVKAKGVQYDKLYPKSFSQPATYIRFSSTVEDCSGAPYCMNDDDVAFLGRLNDGKETAGRDPKDKLSQCSEDTFEEVMSFFEETSSRIQPFANVDNAPILSLEEIEQSVDESLNMEAHKWLKSIYQHWVGKKGTRALMPSIKIRVLDTSSEADDADPYVCFRRREVRQTRKTRGRDAQVVEKLKKLRLELEQARALVQMVVQREQLNKEQLEISRKVFEQRSQLKRVKIEKNIVGDKGDDEELLVNQKPVVKTKGRQDPGPQRPATIRLRSGPDRQAPENDLVSLSDIQEQADQAVQQSIEARKKQHIKWNELWVDRTWDPITPPSDDEDEPPQWAPLLPQGFEYPTPPPSLPSHSSQDKDGDVDMADHPVHESDVKPVISHGWQPEVFFQIPGAWPENETSHKRDPNPACRLRYGRGGRCFLEAKRPRPRGFMSSGVVSDSESDDEEGSEFFLPSERIAFDYRCHMSRTRPDQIDRRLSTVSNEASVHAAAQPAAIASGSGGGG
ncbi:hypothetical protein K431DRAFT_286574 [Polychaeton citri CBS 116435]|uniref:Enhancer of polycomb-like protein n=1 Tax=Polychaeton citri CBS 116435 TaxID=1314669 RepID=A0A9P4Q2Z1_9PEZI|nr:hypothetical protein K431DRAFT_286574 [Polychaeton citri CBS 116435]